MTHVIPQLIFGKVVQRHIVTPDVLAWLMREVFNDPVRQGPSTAPLPPNVVYDHEHRWIGFAFRHAPSIPGNAMKIFDDCAGADRILMEQWGKCVTRTRVRYVGLFAHRFESTPLARVLDGECELDAIEYPDGVEPEVHLAQLRNEMRHPIPQMVLGVNRWGKHGTFMVGHARKTATIPIGGTGFHFRTPGRSGRCFRDVVIAVPGSTSVEFYWHGKNRLMQDETCLIGG